MNEDLKQALAGLEAKFAKGEDITALKTQLEGLNNLSKDDVQAMIDTIKGDLDVSAKLTELDQKIEALKPTPIDEPKKVVTISAFMEDEKNFEAYKSKLRGGGEFEITATTFTRSGVTDSEQGVQLPTIGQLGHKKLSFRDLFAATTFTDKDDNGTIKYIDWDESSTTRAAAAVAEGGTFPESTAVFEYKTVQYCKTGDSLPTTEEVLEDQALIARELEMFLGNNVDIAENNGFINGNGTSPNLLGIMNRVDAYTPVASGIAKANIYDLAVKVSEAITTNKGSKYSPDFALMNISDINAWKLEKDTNGNYIFKGETALDGMVIVEDNSVTANTMVIGDSRYGRIYDKSGYVLSKGVVSNQFIQDQLTLKGRKRSYFLIREADKSGFLKVTSISAALATLATDPA